MTTAHTLGVVLGIILLILMAMPYLAAGAAALARWLIGA